MGAKNIPKGGGLMAWYIIDADGRRKEAFRTRTEAGRYLMDYGDGYRLEFIPSTRLQAMRMQSGMSQPDLAFKADMSLHTLQKWEQGARDINKAEAARVAKVAKVLGCQIEDLLEESS